MPNDVVLYKGIQRRLSTVITGGKITKINQPSEYEVVFTLSKDGKDIPLTISANGDLSRIDVSNAIGENPVSAPAFTMLLRKYLKNARIEDVSLFNYDRIILLTLRSKNELRDNTLFKLYYEAMGRYTNIVLCDEDDVILDAIKRVGIGASDRVIMPGVKYPVQKHVKTPLDDWDKVCDILDNVATATDITAKISGICKDTAVEIMASADKKTRLAQLLDTNGDCGYVYEVNGREVLAPTVYTTLGQPKKVFGDILTATAYLYKNRAEKDNKDKSTKEHQKVLKALKNKYTRMYKSASDILSNADDNDRYRALGELVLCNVYKIKKGDTSLTVTDYATMQEVSIPLDPLKTPKENAEGLFRKYKKGKKAIEIAKSQVEVARVTLDYLDEIEGHLLISSTKAELDEIYQELIKISGKRIENTAKQRKQKPSPIACVDYAGFKIYIGKNNQQNDRVTFEYAKGCDIWLHVKNYHGSHVVIVTENQEVPDDVIVKAASLAAYYSTAKEVDKVDVDYTERKNVKRQGKLLGMVIYKNYKTVTVKPSL